VGEARFTLAGLVAINLGCLVLNLFQTGSFYFLWVAPAVLGLYALQAVRAHRTKAALEPAAVVA
jgi:hypothetical protein